MDSRKRKGGCPDSIRELVEDAEDIKEMIFELWDALCAEMTIPLF